MNLPLSLRESILDQVDAYVDAVDTPNSEAVVEVVIEQLELLQDENEIDDIIGKLEDSGALADPFSEALDEEFTGAAGFVFSGEDVVTTLERLCGIDWIEDEAFDPESLA